MSKRLLGVVALLAVACGGTDQGVIFSQDELTPAGGSAGAVAGSVSDAGAPVVAGGSAQAEAGQPSAGAVTVAGMAAGGALMATAGTDAGGSAGAAQGGSSTGGVSQVAGSSSGGAVAIGGSPSAGAAGAPGTTEKLLLEVVAPEKKMQGSYNHELNAFSSVAIVAAGYKQTNLVTADQACSLSELLNFNNHVIGKRSGPMPALCAAAIASDYTTFQIDFYLGASVGIFAATVSDSDQVKLAGKKISRWEVEVTENDWATVSTAPNVYSWSGSATLRIYGN
jgi:hypothetical protein